MRRGRLALVAVDGEPTEIEVQVVQAALERVVDQERTASQPSMWLRAGRSQGRRLGMFDYRDRFASADAWRLSVRFPYGGREYPGRYGRGDAK